MASADADGGATIVQYVVVRKDLKWPAGALIAQACHASTAAIWASRDAAATRAYLDDADNMHKIVLAAESATALDDLAVALGTAAIAHKRWVERPDDVVTCVASAPYRRDLLAPFFRAFKLLR